MKDADLRAKLVTARNALTHIEKLRTNYQGNGPVIARAALEAIKEK